MAGDWIKMRSNLHEDPDVVAIASLTSGFCPDSVRVMSAQCPEIFLTVGRLHRIWAWANEHSTDGKKVQVPLSFLDGLAACPGFAQAMVDVHWLSTDGKTVSFLRFDRHNGQSAKARAMDSARKKSVRRTSGSKPDKCPQNVRMQTGQKSDQRRDRQTTSVLREEKTTTDNARAREGPSSGVVVPLREVCPEELHEAAIKLSRRVKKLSREDAWWVAWVGQSLEPEFVSRLVKTLDKDRTIESSSGYAMGAIRQKAKESGWAWMTLKSMAPPCPPRKHESNGSVPQEAPA